MVRRISDFRADINGYLGRSSEELPYPRAARLEKALKVWVSEWDWRLAGSSHPALNQMERIVVSGECCGAGEMDRPPRSGWNY